MAKRVAKIIIDADVARSSGVLSKNSRAASCAAVLSAVRSGDFCAVFSPLLLEEWDKNKSHYSTKWLAGMFARKQVCIIFDTIPGTLKDQIVSSANFGTSKIMIKDICIRSRLLNWSFHERG